MQTRLKVSSHSASEPDGQIAGVEPGDLDKAKRSLAQSIGNKFQPAIQYTFDVLEVSGKRVVVVSATRNRDVAYHEFDGRAYIREGTSTRQLTLAEKQSLQSQRDRRQHNGPWKCDLCGSWVGMLSSIVISDRGAHKSYACSCGGEYWPAV